MRFLRGLAALVALVGLLVGIPVALVIFGGNPLPDDLSAQTLMRAFFAPASDRVLLGIVAAVGWLAWAGFVLSVAAEIVNVASGRRIQLRLPGLGVGQKLAATLIVLVVAMLATPHLTPTASAAPTAPPTSSSTATAPTVPGRAAPLLTPSSGAHAHTPDGSATSSAAGSPVRAVTGDREHRLSASAEADRDPTPVGAPSGTHGAKASRVVTHEVKRGDFLWSLSERYLGEGSRWKEIARANPGVDPDQLHIGQHLRIPVPASSAYQDGGQGTSSRAEQADTIKVERGDNLSEISEDLYGTQRHWPELYRENRDQISDPDLINPGQTLRLPERDHAARPDHKVTHHDAGEASRAERRADREPDSTRPSPVTPRSPAEQRTPPQASPAAPTAPDEPLPTAVQPTAGQPTAVQPTAESQPSAASAPARTAPTAPADQGRPAGQGAPAPGADERVTAAEVAVGSGASVGLLLAAGLVTRLTLRRRRQLQMRRPGRRVVPAGVDAQAFEHNVRTQHEPMRVEQLDQVLRAIAAHAHRAGTDLPALSAIRVDDQRIDLLLQAPALQPPPGIEVAADGSVWTVHAGDVAAVLNVDGIDDTSPPYPALVTLGRDRATAHILIDLEAAGALSIAADDTGTAAAMLSTIALELAISPWAADVNLTLVGPLLPGLAETLDHPSLTHIDNAAQALDGLEVRATAQRRHLAGDSVGQKRADPELADAWCPHVVLIAEELDDDDAARLARIVTDLPRVAVAAVTTGPAATRWRYRLDDAGEVAHLEPHSWDLTPQLVSSDDYAKILRLVASSGTDETEPAPWWDHGADPTETASPTPATTLPVPHPLAVEQEGPADRADRADQDEQDQDAGGVRAAAGGLGADESADAADDDEDAEQGTGEDSSDEGERVENAARVVIRPMALRPALSLHTLTGPAGSAPAGLGVFGHAQANPDDAPHGAGKRGDAGPDDAAGFTAGRSSAADALDLDTLGPDFTEPTLLILGPPALNAGAGQTNTRYQRRSLEVMLYLLEHPGTTSATLISRFYISRDYAKSLISALRKMLGRDPEGRLYLPELSGAGGGYMLDPLVTSDWARVQRLIGRGVNTAADENLMHVLGMIRGTPLEGAEDWVGADVLQPDISSTISDVAHQLVDRALDRNDLDLARWAAARGLVAEPESETLLVDRLRTEAQAGNRSEVARISGRIESSVRYLGGTMCEQTQEVLRVVSVYR